MSLDLDTRQRAMLAEMKVPLWWPETAPAAPAEALVQAPAQPPVDATKSIANHQARAWTQGQNDAEHASPARPLRPLATAPHAGAVAQMDWPELAAAVAGCQACGLCERRRQPALGTGHAAAPWMWVGDAPDADDDAQGAPFAGTTGRLLDNMLKAMGLGRATDPAAGSVPRAYLAHAVKCRPPGDRKPEPAELAQCEPFLARQVALVQPAMLLALGRFAANTLLAESVPGVASVPLGKLRGQVHRYRGIPVVVTFDVPYLTRNPAEKAKAWADLCFALDVAAQAGRSPA